VVFRKKLHRPLRGRASFRKHCHRQVFYISRPYIEEVSLLIERVCPWPCNKALILGLLPSCVTHLYYKETWSSVFIFTVGQSAVWITVRWCKSTVTTCCSVNSFFYEIWGHPDWRLWRFHTTDCCYWRQLVRWQTTFVRWMSGVEPRKVAIGRAEILLECNGVIMGEGLRDWGEAGWTTFWLIPCHLSHNGGKSHKTCQGEWTYPENGLQMWGKEGRIWSCRLANG